jgi:hypothetical protein
MPIGLQVFQASPPTLSGRKPSMLKQAHPKVSACQLYQADICHIEVSLSCHPDVSMPSPETQ